MKTFHLLFLLSTIFVISCQDKFELEQVQSTPKDAAELRAVVSGIDYYNYPGNAPTGRYYSAKINGNNYFVYQMPNAKNYKTDDPCSSTKYEPDIISFGIANSSGANIEIKTKVDISSFKVRPDRITNTATSSTRLSNFTVKKTDSRTLLLTITGPQYLSVEINNDLTKPLLVFANTLETNVPNRQACKHYFDAGTIYDVGVDNVLSSGDIVYIAPGAIVKGTFKTAKGASNVKIMGRGILSGENVMRTSTNSAPYMIALRNATDCAVEGITIVSSQNWVMPLFNCDRIRIEHVKIASITGYEDGIDIVGGYYINVKNCFIWTKDDCVAVKAGVNYLWEDFNNGIDGKSYTHTITVQNCVLWSGERGNALQIGCELNTDILENMYFENIDIIHAQNTCGTDIGALSIDNNGNATVKWITYHNIYMEDVQRYFINIKTEQTRYSPKGTEYQYNVNDPYKGGTVHDIIYKNIYLNKKTGTANNNPIHSGISNYSIVNGNLINGSIRGVTFENLYINKSKILSFDPVYANRYGGTFVLMLNNVNASTHLIRFK
ncbi:MAG: hypothetical protein LBL17_03065 [Coxiellaceae bacterium]|jgi:hypothetical protein|nr:hypothetical protein [Coxiellaceae bacterium]